jgi:homoserine kinase type II
LPVPPAIKDRHGAAIQQLQGRPACLIRFLPGVSLSHPTSDQALAAGRAMAEMHVAVADFPLTRMNSMGIETWRPLFERCGRSLDDIASGLHDEIGAALDEVERDWPADGERIAIHADLFPDNVLMRGDAVTGLIDFYFACTDLRLFDVAIMHSAWAFDATGEHYNAAVAEALLQGYGDVPDGTSFATLASGACVRFALSRAWDWLNTPTGALVTRKDPLAYVRRLRHYAAA